MCPVPIPEQLRTLVHDPAFWAAYLFLDEDEVHYPQLADCRAEFVVAGGYGVTLDLDADLLGVELGLRRPGSAKPVELGWDDQLHWHPHALRWEELDLIGRCVALNEPSLPHPGLPVALLCRFAPISVGDNVDVLVPLVQTALLSAGSQEDGVTPPLPGLTLTRSVSVSGRPSNPIVGDYLQRIDRRHAGFTWRHDDRVGWYLHQSEEDEKASGVGLYTLRCPENAGDDGFPFADWNTLVDRAQRRYAQAVNPAWRTRSVVARARRIFAAGDLGDTPALGEALRAAGCEHPTILHALAAPAVPARVWWVIELLLGEPLGSLASRCAGPTWWKPKRYYELSVNLAIRHGRRVVPKARRDRIRAALDAALHARELGYVNDGAGATYGPDKRGRRVQTSEDLSVIIRDDLERGVAVVRAVLAQTRAPQETKVRMIIPPRGEIPWP
jgi:hypothetical protein